SSVKIPNTNSRLLIVPRSRCILGWKRLRKCGASKTSNRCASATQTWRARWRKSNHSLKNGPVSKSRNGCSLVVCVSCCDCRLGTHCSDRYGKFLAERAFQSHLLSRVDLRGPLLAVACQ